MKHTDIDVAVIGGGSAGLVAAAGCAAFGARTALIERQRLGGECTWTGCIPSKALLHIAKHAHRVRSSETQGIEVDGLNIDFKAVMESVRTTRKDVYQRSESPSYLQQLGIRPMRAAARFRDQHTIEIERAGRTKTLTFRSAIIATGSRPAIPDIPGLDAIDYLTTDTVFEIDHRPDRLVILGGGPTGVELAQAFSRLGSTVHLICHDDRLLAGFDPDASSLLRDVLEREGVEIHLRSTLGSVQPSGAGFSGEVVGDGANWEIAGDRLLIATGRLPNTGSLDLGMAGVHQDGSGIPVDPYCRTSARHIFASGDVTNQPNQTHIGENMSKAAAVNAIAKLPILRFESKVVPRVIYTDPEIATVGRSGQELEDGNERFDTIDFPFEKIDRAVVEHASQGFIRIHHRFGRVLGATIAGPQAGELITEYAIAMKNSLRLNDLSGTVHPYPTMMLGARRAADQVFFRALKPWMVRGVQLLYGYRGNIPDYIGTKSIV